MFKRKISNLLLISSLSMIVLPICAMKKTKKIQLNKDNLGNINNVLQELEQDQENIVNSIIDSFRCEECYFGKAISPKNILFKDEEKVRRLENVNNRMLEKINNREKENSHLLNKNKKNPIRERINNIKHLQQEINKTINFLRNAGRRSDIHSEIISLKEEFLKKGRNPITKEINIQTIYREKNQSNNPIINNNNEEGNNSSDRPNVTSLYRSVKVAICISCVVIGIIVIAKKWAK